MCPRFRKGDRVTLHNIEGTIVLDNQKKLRNFSIQAKIKDQMNFEKNLELRNYVKIYKYGGLVGVKPYKQRIKIYFSRLRTALEMQQTS